MKITKEQLKQIILEEYKKRLTEAAEIPDLAKSGAASEETIQRILPEIERATGGNEELKKLVLKRLFQLLQKEGGVEAV